MNIEQFCGLRVRRLSSPSIGGSIKSKAEDFVVEEVPVDLPSGNSYLLCKLMKKDIDTIAACERITKALRVPRDSVTYAGTKDKKAVTTQYITIRAPAERVRALKIPNISLEILGHVGDYLKLGDLQGNKFSVTIRGIRYSEQETKKRLAALAAEIKERGVPNFYGLQRFGESRPVTHLVGREIVKGNFKKAVFLYLTQTFSTEGKDTAKARDRLAKEKDFGAALQYFPPHLLYERILLEHLARREDYLAALLALPRGLKKMLVHAYQSYIFNLSLSAFLRGKNSVENFPAKIVGYDTTLEDSAFDKCIQKVLSSEGISLKHFKIKEADVLSAHGSFRSALLQPEIEYEVGDQVATLKFFLKKGCYATILLREVL